MLLVNPEVVLAAIENSERLGKLNSKMCRPLDGPTTATAAEEGSDESAEETETASSAS
jgi:hypothetical protein